MSTPAAIRHHPDAIAADPPSSVDHEEPRKLHSDKNAHISCPPPVEFSTPRNVFRHISHGPTKRLSLEKDSDFRWRH